MTRDRMKTVSVLAKEREPENLWASLGLGPEERTPESVDAFIRVLKRIDHTKEEILPAVLVDVKRMGTKGVLQVIRRLDGPLSAIPIEEQHLEKILGLYVSGTVAEEDQTRILAEIFLQLVREELKKKRYEYKRLRNVLIEGLTVHRWEEYRAGEIYADVWAEDDRPLCSREAVLNECREIFPEMEKHLYWHEILNDLDFSRELLRRISPADPPPAERLTELKKMILHNVSIRRIRENHLFGKIVSLVEFDDAVGDQYLKFKASGLIVVDHAHIKGNQVPLVYRMNQAGERSQLRSEDIKGIGQYSIVIRDEDLKNDLDLAVGYVFMYLLYPLRMYRELKEKQLRALIEILRR